MSDDNGRWVPAPRQPEVGALQRIAESALQPTNGDIDAHALRALETVSEASTPRDRAVAVRIKSQVVIALSIIVTVALYLAGAPGWLSAAALVVLAVVGVGWVNWLDARYSPIGNERHKTDTYADIRHHEIESNERVALAKLDAYTKTLERVYGNRDGGSA